ncbi:hypothetical protein VP01_1762g3 [Puccinia sorghi]|uniref:Uncharacterized protein n=1 Tax=Puccinia sorghi TaxID=27349 RepID=A0A0L6VEZ5_9BASI|nr:hypothetical protein VP01_1762g3 [Puccinia sorghi]
MGEAAQAPSVIDHQPQSGLEISSATGQRTCAHLRHKGLIMYITEAPVALAGAAANAANKKHTETVDILMNYMSETAFEAVVTPDNKESPFEI